MQFSYRVIDENKEFNRGKIEAADRDAAKKTLLDNKWHVIELIEIEESFGWLNKAFESKLSFDSISAFCSQMAMMIRTGANLIKGLEILKNQTKDKDLKRIIGILLTEVSRGSSLSAAMRSCGNSLPVLLVNLIAVGEESGNLDKVLNNMAEYYSRENFIRKKIAAASVYPIILTFVLIGILVFFMNIILPEISGLLTENGGDLPLITQIVIGTANFFGDYYIVIVLGLAVLIATFIWALTLPKFRLIFDSFKLGLPMFGQNLRNIITARFCRTMALFLKASIPIVPILDSMEKIVGNEVARIATVQAKESIIGGKALAASFKEEQFFDEMVIQMMTIGEETGQLDDLMEDIASYYDKHVEIGISKMVALVEPAFTIIIGILAGIMIISVALPIMNLSTTIN